MRSVEQIDRDLEAAKERLAELEHERLVAEEDRKRPGRSMVRRRYELIQKVLEQLDSLGEHVTDAEGYALHIKGKTFEINPTSGVQEV